MDSPRGITSTSHPDNVRLSMTQHVSSSSPPSLKISTIARSNTILKKLVLEAKREYEKDAEHRVHIFLGDT